MTRTCYARYLSALVPLLALMATAPAGAEIVASYYRPDKAFPEFSYFWGESAKSDWGPEDQAAARPLGGSVHVFIQNTGATALQFKDVLLDDVSLTRAVAFSDARKFKGGKILAANIHFAKLSEKDYNLLLAAGEPIWWRIEPRIVPPGGTAELIIRLRRTPQKEYVNVRINFDGGASGGGVMVKADSPQFEGISFSLDLTQVYLYPRHPQAGKSPSKILMDGADITPSSVIGACKNMSTVPVVSRLKSPLVRGSFHVFQAVYDGGTRATAGIRAYADEMRYGMWGGKPGKKSQVEIGRGWLEEMAAHNVNLQMEMIGSAAVAQFMKTEEGRHMMQTLGIKRVVGEPEKDPSPHAYYLADEPDAADSRVPEVPDKSKVGSLAQGLSAWAEELRGINASIPTMVNVDMTYKPDNWYIYGQLADIYAADPYYQTRLAEAYFSKPHLLPYYTKATFVYAVGSICNSACAPRPLHLILNCTRRQDENRKFRFGTPAEKRIEVFYSLAAGAKHLSYWWYLPIAGNAKGSSGVGADDPDARALWREIGILGAEVRTAGPLITKSCPAPLPVTAPRYLWVRSLLAGLDSAIILCVNDDYANDRAGTTYKPVQDAEVSVTMPTWLKPQSVFEISSKGVQEVKWDESDGKLNLHLGTVDITRMVIVTSDPALRGRLQQLYTDKFAPNVSAL